MRNSKEEFRIAPGPEAPQSHCACVGDPQAITASAGHRTRPCQGLASPCPAGSSNHGAPRLTLSFFKPSFWVSVNCTCSSSSRRCRTTTSLSFLSTWADVSSRSPCRSSSSFIVSAAGRDSSSCSERGSGFLGSLPYAAARWPAVYPS